MSTPESFNEAINVLHVDDHPAIVQAGRDYLRERFPVAEYVGLDCYREAQERLEQQQFSVIILDLLVGGSILLERIRPFAECAPTIIWSMRFNYGVIRTALDYGVRGFVGKHEPITVLEDAIGGILCSKRFFLSGEAQEILSEGGMSTSLLPTGFYSLGPLSRREIQVLRLVGQGHGTDEASQSLNVSPKTVETYRRRVREKLGLPKPHHLAPFAVQWLQDGEPRYLKFPQGS